MPSEALICGAGASPAAEGRHDRDLHDRGGRRLLRSPGDRRFLGALVVTAAIASPIIPYMAARQTGVASAGVRAAPSWWSRDRLKSRICRRWP